MKYFWLLMMLYYMYQEKSTADLREAIGYMSGIIIAIIFYVQGDLKDAIKKGRV